MVKLSDPCLILLVIVGIELSECFLGGGHGKRDSEMEDINKFYLESKVRN